MHGILVVHVILALQVRVRCATFRKESAMIEEATSASVKASVQPEASKTSPQCIPEDHLYMQATHHNNMH